MSVKNKDSINYRNIDLKLQTSEFQYYGYS